MLLCDEKEKDIEVLCVEDIFPIDRFKVAKIIFGTHCGNYPSIKRLFSMFGSRCVVGEMKLINFPDATSRHINLTPDDIRTEIKRLGWKKANCFMHMWRITIY